MLRWDVLRWGVYEAVRVYEVFCAPLPRHTVHATYTIPFLPPPPPPLLQQARLHAYETTTGGPSPTGPLEHDAAHRKLQQLTEKVGGMVRSMEMTQASVTAALAYDAMDLYNQDQEGSTTDLHHGATVVGEQAGLGGELERVSVGVGGKAPVSSSSLGIMGGPGAPSLRMPSTTHAMEDAENTPPPVRRGGGGIPTSSPYGFAAANALPPLSTGKSPLNTGKPTRSLKSHALTIDGGEESVTSEQTSAARVSLASVVSLKGDGHLGTSHSPAWLRRG